MKVIIFGILAVISVVQSAVVPLQTVKTIVPVASTLVRTPALDSAVIDHQRVDGSFRYATVENHAYTPVIYETIPQWNIIPQYPVVYPYPSSQYYPVYNIIPSYPPAGVPAAGAPNPENPIEVEDPADNANNEIKEENKDEDKDDDTVTIETA